MSTEILALAAGGTLVLVAAVASIAPYLGSSTELVRIRNALLLRREDGVSLEWTPASVPLDFLHESADAPPAIADAARALHLERMDGDWARALAIGAYMLRATQPGVGGPIQSGLMETHRRVVTEGQGYCGDFVEVFTAIALASGLEVRTWAFSFDGFGGHGHTFNEVWDRALNAWRMIDVFNNYYFVDTQGEPLSAADFHQCLVRGETYDFIPVLPTARPGFAIETKAREYYNRGADQWYQWWGNNVFSYDRSPLVRLAGMGPRFLSQLAAIVSGVHPRMHILRTPKNSEWVSGMVQVRRRVIGAAIAAGLGTSLLIAAGCLWFQGASMNLTKAL